LNAIPDYQQYPAARCALGEGISMFQCTASSSVESMNCANQAVRKSTAVDPVNAVILLPQLEGKRYGEHRDKAWDWSEELTPHGKQLVKTAFAEVNLREYEVTINPEGNRYCCVVNWIVSPNKNTCLFHAIEENGSIFGDCGCGVPRVDGISCWHMVAVCKSKKIEGLNETNIMPVWWHTSHWRRQYLQRTLVENNFSIETLRNNTKPSQEFHLCPEFSSGRKPGQSNEEKRHKSAMEKSMERKVNADQKKKKKKKKKEEELQKPPTKKRKAKEVSASKKNQLGHDLVGLWKSKCQT
jgi:hypothetical protein